MLYGLKPRFPEENGKPKQTQERTASEGGPYRSKPRSTVRSDCATTKRGVTRVCGGSGGLCRVAGIFCRGGCVRGRGRGRRWSCGNCSGGFRQGGFRARRPRCVRRECRERRRECRRRRARWRNWKWGG